MINTITPSFAIKISGDTTPITTWNVTISSGNNQVTKTNNSMEIEGDILYVRMTQEEYRKIGNSANVQISVKNSAGVDITDSIRVVWARLSSSVPSGGGTGGGGQDGFSPIITVTSITGGHRVTVTDVNGTKSFNVMDGTNGEDGENAVLPQIDTVPVKNSTHLITSGGVASAIENFISTETDPTVPTWVKDITQEDISKWNSSDAGTQYAILSTVDEVKQNAQYGNLVDAMVIKEVFQSVSEGKRLIALAITDKGVYTSAEDTFARIAENIAMIQGGEGGEGVVIKRLINFSVPAPEGYPQIRTVILGMKTEEEIRMETFVKAGITVTEGQAMENVL